MPAHCSAPPTRARRCTHMRSCAIHAAFTITLFHYVTCSTFRSKRKSNAPLGPTRDSRAGRREPPTIARLAPTATGVSRSKRPWAAIGATHKRPPCTYNLRLARCAQIDSRLPVPVASQDLPRIDSRTVLGRRRPVPCSGVRSVSQVGRALLGAFDAPAHKAADTMADGTDREYDDEGDRVLP